MGTIKDMLKKMERFQQDIENISKISIPITPDKNGMIDRQCPKSECESLFKIHKEDWLNIVRDEEVFCPFCKNNSEAKSYLTIEQNNEVIGDLKKSIKELWDYGYSTTGKNISIKPRPEFELNIKCEKCNCRYSVVGSAYFCPSCGDNNIEVNARKAIEKIISNANNIAIIQETLETSLNKDEATIITKSIVEKSISEIVGTLQNYSESIYNSLSEKNAPFNAFQNVEKSNKLWVSLLGKGYKDWLTQSEIKHLHFYTQKRHLLEHKGGIVDSKYIEKTGDNKYQVGERIIIKPSDSICLGEITIKLLNQISELKKASS
ncbi:hypothetical protein J8L85_13670 [Maribacter sp. MMG018]|uniref:hypothetical protein n=1 Tax=Maribacter sp. MMG018 TaxID=2822688 RepID=UPI001B398B01|nr:hypothetical protein [Maribacter sp. MMG018]MBQ4915498.1 hypothetical protein [Maribacter sp. MMG018]